MSACPDELLAACLERRLTGAERSAVLAHVARCADCAEIFAGTLDFIDAAPAGEVAAPSAAFTPEPLMMAGPTVSPPSRPQPSSAPSWWPLSTGWRPLAAALGTALVAILGTRGAVTVWRGSGDPPPTRPVASDLPPAAGLEARPLSALGLPPDVERALQPLLASERGYLGPGIELPQARGPMPAGSVPTPVIEALEEAYEAPTRADRVRFAALLLIAGDAPRAERRARELDPNQECAGAPGSTDASTAGARQVCLLAVLEQALAGGQRAAAEGAFASLGRLVDEAPSDGLLAFNLALATEKLHGAAQAKPAWKRAAVRLPPGAVRQQAERRAD